MAYVNAACAGHVAIFSTCGKFHLVSNFTQLHILTLAAHSYALLYTPIMLDNSLHKTCMMYRTVTVNTKLNYSLLSQYTPILRV